MPEESTSIRRRHDLDALRSFAMLLGIALHAALAYIGVGWIVSDSQTSSTLGVVVAGIHGFRMPLFFLLSGFFSAMLWRRHGLAGLMAQRTRRILIPLAIGCLTVVPAMWAVTGWAISQNSEAIIASQRDHAGPPRAIAPDIWTAAAQGDLEALRIHAADPALLDAPDPMYGVTPMGWTVIKNTPDATRRLLELGAAPDAQYADKNTPMHTACFFGRAEVAEHLLRAGADLSIVSAAGEQPIHSMRHNRQTTEFIANLLGLPIDFDQVADGRQRIRAMLEDPDIQKSGATVHQPADAPEKAGTLEWLMHGVFFHHLWFLWFLCWLNAGFAAVVLLIGRLPNFAAPSSLVSAPLCLLWAVPLTMLTQSEMHARGAMPGFGPDTSAGLIPVPHVLLHYATFFAFGALLFTKRGAEAKIGRWWIVMLPIALATLPLGLFFGYEHDRAAELVGGENARRWVSNIVQALYAWLMTLGMLGLCESVLARDRPWVRYVSDSSYWLYLVHLPLIIAGQAMLLRLDVPVIPKFALLTLSATAALLASYQLAVRHTPIGALLNGKRPRPGHAFCTRNAP